MFLIFFDNFFPKLNDSFLAKIYLLCFLIGCIYTFVTFIFGGLSDILNFDFDVDFPDSTDFIALLPIKPFMIMSFITVFGGVGLILFNFPIFYNLQFITLPISLISGYLASKSINKFIYRPLQRLQTTVKKQSAAIGKEATVLETILPGKFGRISYSIDSNILSGAAKESKSGNGLKKGEKVLIDNIIENVFYVSKINNNSN